MTLHPVTSQTIHSIGYDPATKRMQVSFHAYDKRKSARLYEFEQVTPEQHAAFMAAQSKGKHFGEHFRGKVMEHPCRRIIT